MTKDELNSLYWVDEDTGCYHWRGAVKVRYAHTVWYPHRLLWRIEHKSPVSPKHSLVRLCASEDCIAPAHHAPRPKQSPIADYQYPTVQPASL